MSAVIDLPPAPLVAGQDPEIAGAVVVAHCMDGGIETGQLQSLSGPHRALVLRRSSGETTITPFAKLRYLAFSTPLIPAAGPHPLEQRKGDVVMPTQAQPFRIDFDDGKVLKGLTRSSLSDEFGIHLFPEHADGLMRLFVPFGSIKEFQIGPLLLGKQDIEQHVIERRSKAIGKSAPRHVAGSVAELCQVLNHQSHVSSKALGQLLLEEGLITPEQLETALAAHMHSGGRRLGEVLEEMGAISPETILLVLARKLGLPFVRLREFDVDRAAVTQLTADLVRRYGVMPLCVHNERLVVAAKDPTNSESINALQFVTGRSIEVAMASKVDIDRAIEEYYGAQEHVDVLEAMEEPAPVTEETSEAVAERLAQEKPIVRLVHNIIVEGIRRGASDIHIRPGDSTVDLLFRIDGSMVKIRSFSKALLRPVVSRIKIIGRMNISERRIPQDGQARMVGKDSVVDLRFSVMPMVAGESVVIRILNTQAALKGIHQIGFAERDREVFLDLLSKSFGIILVTGPTGSGKSTTLYAALNEMRQQNLNIITVEDPVEFHIESIEQAQVNIAAGYTFARALRNILRHDPDVIMIGEIRDEETARIAVQSALTGHIVLSTLHTNSAAATVTRLLQMGIEPYLVNSAVQGVLAQRLVRRNCPKCTTEEVVEPHIRRALGIGEDEVFYRGKGCEECNQTGYQGRIAVHELLTMTPGLRELIAPGVNIDEIQNQAIKDGMMPLMKNTLAAARERKTSLAEVYRIRLE